jgi:hypothetical protein
MGFSPLPDETGPGAETVRKAKQIRQAGRRIWVSLSLRFVIALATLVLSAGCNEKPAPAQREAPSREGRNAQNVRTVRAVGQLGPGRGTLLVSPEAPADAKLTAGAPLSVEASGEHFGFPPRSSTKLDPAKLPLRIPIDVADGAMGPVRVKLAYHWCGKAEGASCRPERVELVVDLDTSGDAPGGEAHVTYRPDS